MWNDTENSDAPSNLQTTRCGDDKSPASSRQKSFETCLQKSAVGPNDICK